MVINVQFVDESKSTVLAYFGCPQDPAVYANLGTLDTSDSRWRDYVEALPEAARSGVPSPTP